MDQGVANGTDALPIFPHMTEGQVARVCDAVRQAATGRGARVA